MYRLSKNVRGPRTEVRGRPRTCRFQQLTASRLRLPVAGGRAKQGEPRHPAHLPASPPPSCPRHLLPSILHMELLSLLVSVRGVMRWRRAPALGAAGGGRGGGDMGLGGSPSPPARASGHRRAATSLHRFGAHGIILSASCMLHAINMGNGASLVTGWLRCLGEEAWGLPNGCNLQTEACKGGACPRRL